MRKISDTIARLSALQARHADPFASPDVSGRLQPFEGFGANPGHLEAQRFVPENLPVGAPLVVVLHGCTQSASGYDHHSGWSRLADEAGFALLYPEQQRGNNPNLCFNWFQPRDAGRGSGEAHSIHQMIETMVETYSLDRKRIFITGLSAGGAMACAMLAAYPEMFSGGAVIAGLPYGSATTVPEAFDRMRGHGGPSESDLQNALRAASDHRGSWPKISIWHGTADHTVMASNADAVAGQWRKVHNVENAPTQTAAGRNTKRVWNNHAGEAVIEVNMITGMGHGTPIGDGLGAPGPYMLDVGISSTREIASFWGIAAREESPVRAKKEGQLALRPVAGPSRKPDAARPDAMLHLSAVTRPNPSKTASEAPGVRKIIEDALRAAGLMR